MFSFFHILFFIEYKCSVMNMKLEKRDYKKLLIYIAIPLLLGGLVGFLTRGGTSNYDSIVPGYVFPIVWSILYILMGISSYLIRDNERLLNIYKINLVFNFLWPFVFFSLDLKTLAFFWILLLIVIVGIMIYEFYKENKLSAYLLIPYLFWLIFASILNLMAII